MKISALIKSLEVLAPLSLQESYDNAGLIIGSPEKEIDKALITLDVTEEVMDEALNENCQLIIAHHPLIFGGVKKINGKNLVEKLIIRAIKNDIAIYAIHTNLDNISTGVNSMLAKKLDIQNPKILLPAKSGLKKIVTFCPTKHLEKVRSAMFKAGAGHIGNYSNCSFRNSGLGSFKALEDTKPFVGTVGELHEEEENRLETVAPDYLVSTVVNAMIKAHPYEEVAYDIYSIDNKNTNVGAGMIGQIKPEQDAKDFLLKVKKILGATALRHSPLNEKKVQSVAICGGSGSFLINAARNSMADIFITGDIKYHDFFDHHGVMTIVDAGHFETEQFTKDLLYDFLKQKFPNFALQISGINTNPVSFL